MNLMGSLLKRATPVPEVPSAVSRLPGRKIATTGLTAAASLVAVSAVSAATSARRRRVEGR